MAAPLKIILCFSCFFFALVIFQTPLFSDEVRQFSKIFNQQIFSLSSGLFFIPV